MTDRERLAEAAKRVEEAIAYGAKIRGIELPPDFAVERARNIVSALVDLFEDARAEGYEVGFRVGAPVGAAIDAEVLKLITPETT